jgi:polysaccharide pyruvyl transferase WcaK-like protein
LQRFAGRPLVGLNLTLLEPLEAWDPFDLLVERDSSRASRPDLAFLSARPRVPVVGVVLIDSQPEYGQRDRHRAANEALRRLAAGRDVAAVEIDTRLDANRTGLRSAAQVESLVARVDAVVTTRLHGTVLALKNGVPALAVDPVAGGAKVLRQARTLGWPVAFAADALDERALEDALDYCLTEAARAQARACAERARQALRGVREAFLANLAGRG